VKLGLADLGMKVGYGSDLVIEEVGDGRSRGREGFGFRA